mgnify:CR=1 FL=1
MVLDIHVHDNRNNSNNKRFFIARYSKPEIEIVRIDNGILDNDTIYVLEPKTTITIKAKSVIGITKITYTLNGNTYNINVNNQKEYTFTIEIPY